MPMEPCLTAEYVDRKQTLGQEKEKKLSSPILFSRPG